jgi:hypothetical protein
VAYKKTATARAQKKKQRRRNGFGFHRGMTRLTKKLSDAGGPQR